MEDFYVIPENYFSKEAADHYERSPRMRKVQRELTERAIELLELKKGRVIDVGCGTGFSLAVLKERGFDAVGVDISQPMLDIAKKKGLSVKRADFACLPFNDGTFDGLLSISSLQWVYGKSYEDILDKYSKIAKEFYRILKEGGRGVVQFYPKSEEEFNTVLKMFKKAGFKVTLAIDYPHIRKKTKKFVILTKPNLKQFENS
jgi:18S rRNA (guanine1575-N7)-methyltransferase